MENSSSWWLKNNNITLRFSLSETGWSSLTGIRSALRYRCRYTSFLRTSIAPFIEGTNSTLHIALVVNPASPELILCVYKKRGSVLPLMLVDGLALHLLSIFRKFLGAPVVVGGVYVGPWAVSTWSPNANKI